MYVILLSGGSGKRLWPLSTERCAKQFLPLFSLPDGRCISMVQRVYRQICQVISPANIVIAASGSQVGILQEQLGENVAVCIEPCRRDTFPAIALASAYLHDVKKIDFNEVVVVCPVDPYVETRYFETMCRLADLVEENRARLMLMGIEPANPSAKYGYIMPVDKGELSKVAKFHEKPDLVTTETVRRLTPIECERLQGLPDNYTNVHVKGQKTSDAARYKALGNGMAQPCADFVIRRIVMYAQGVI